MKITINKKEYPVKFGYGALKILCKKWGSKTIGGLDKHFQKLQFTEGEEPTIDQWDLIGDLVAAGISNANDSSNVTPEDVITALFKNPNQLTDVIEAFAESLPKQEAVNPESRGN